MVKLRKRIDVREVRTMHDGSVVLILRGGDGIRIRRIDDSRSQAERLYPNNIGAGHILTADDVGTLSDSMAF